jgi:hypothetical protein
VDFLELLSSLKALWILWIAFFVTIYSLTNNWRARTSRFENILAATIVAIATLTVGWDEGRILNALMGLLGGLILGVVIPFLIKRH